MKGQDLANYIINRAIELENPVSNLKLQKILYFSNLLYFKKNKSFLIDDLNVNPFKACQIGPVIENIYHKYSNYGGLSINISQLEPKIIDDEKFLNNIVFKLININLNILATWCYNNNSVWAKIYNNGEGNHQIIDENFIKQDVKNFINLIKDIH